MLWECPRSDSIRLEELGVARPDTSEWPPCPVNAGLLPEHPDFLALESLLPAISQAPEVAAARRSSRLPRFFFSFLSAGICAPAGLAATACFLECRDGVVHRTVFGGAFRPLFLSTTGAACLGSELALLCSGALRIRLAVARRSWAALKPGFRLFLSIGTALVVVSCLTRPFAGTYRFFRQETLYRASALTR